jgi:hypothetical protein
MHTVKDHDKLKVKFGKRVKKVRERDWESERVKEWESERVRKRKRFLLLTQMKSKLSHS